MISDLMSARGQMALSLGFHIIFACISMVMPFFMVAARWQFHRTQNPLYEKLEKFWSHGVAILFAIGAVSGTFLSFELGLLWPNFMEHAGPIIGMPFSLEGTAFFLEAIFIGIYLYGRNKISFWAHLTSGIMVGIMGVASGILVVAANAWMNSPSGFDWINGAAHNIDPIAAMLNKAWFSQSQHMIIAAFAATGFLTAGIHALLLLKKPYQTIHKLALKIVLPFTMIAALILPLSGDVSAKDVAKRQPIKLAAMEAHFDTEAGASLIIGGIPNEETGTVTGAIKIPNLLSVLAFNDPNATVQGLNDFPKTEWPPVKVVHFAFQIMVGLGTLMAGFATMYWMNRLFKKRDLIDSKGFLKSLVALMPAGFIALEAGWTVTEVGRQPWIVYGIMRTEEALTPMPGLSIFFLLTTIGYLILGTLVVVIMGRLFQEIDNDE